MTSVLDIASGLPDDQEWVDLAMRRNSRLTSNRLSAPMLEARGLSSAPAPLVPVPLGSSIPGTKLAPSVDIFAPQRTRYEENAVYFHPPRVDELGNVYEAVSRPSIAPEIQESWMRLKQKALFDNDFIKFAQMYPYFKARGEDPAEIYNRKENTIGAVGLSGGKTRGSQIMIEIAARVDRDLQASSIRNGFEGLQIRPIAGSSRISLHATGNAIDIDAKRNPHIKSMNEIAVVKEVTDIDLSKAQSRDTLRAASRRFVDNFDIKIDALRKEQYELAQNYKSAKGTPAEIQARQKYLRTILDSVDGERKRHKRGEGDYDRWSRNGFFSLPDPLIDAFWAADSNVVWGGEYITSKDFMHFEYNPALRASLDRQAKKRALQQLSK